jgi:hypothetical protein
VTELIPTGGRAEALRCVVASGAEWLDFGPVAELRQYLRW